MAQVAARLREEVGNARLLPVATVIEGFPRMMRDLARRQGKEVIFECRGEDTQVDRAVLELVKAPLTHLLRNAVDHGIEPPGERLAAGKLRQGRVVVEASQRGGRLLLVVSDDGAGIDPERVKAAAMQAGMLRSEDAAALSDRQALHLIFRSGLSTTATVTDLSGRGVGLDVVRDHVERLNGIIEVESPPGGGATFTFILPLSVATRRCVLFREAGQTLALPVTSVLRVLRVGREQTRHAGGGRAIRVEGQP
ncbi:MAG: chemotaxis protein CheA, partial [Actinomycetota bacterium]